MSDLARFRIAVDATGQGTIEVNGDDVSARVRAVSFQAQVGDVPVVTLHTLSADTEIEGEGVVRVVPPGEVFDDEDAREAVVAFLAGVDPKWLDNEVLQRSSWGSGSPIALMLEVLRERADGAR